MSLLPRHRRLTPTASVFSLLAAVIIVGWSLAPEGHSQAPAAPSTPNSVLLGLLGRLQTQQTQITANQTKIEAQTALLKEELRQAKIYAGRTGGHR